MRKEVGISPGESNVPSSEKQKLSPTEIQDIIIQSHFSAYQEKKTAFKSYSLTFFKQYEKSPEGQKVIKLLTKTVKKININDLRQSFVSGLSTNLAVANQIPELSDYQPKEITQAYTYHLFLLANSIDQIPDHNRPSKLVAKQLIEHPNYFDPDFYSSLVNQVEYNSYYNKSSIFRAILYTPRRINQILDANKQRFDLVVKKLKESQPNQPINYRLIRQFVDKGRGKENQNPYPDFFQQTNIPSDMQTPCQQTAQLISSLSHSTPEFTKKPKNNLPQENQPNTNPNEVRDITNKQIIQLETKTRKYRNKIDSLQKKIRYLKKSYQNLSQDMSIKTAALETTKQQLTETIESLERDKRLQAEKIEQLSQALTAATSPPETRQPTPTSNIRTDLDTSIPTEKTQKEKSSTLKLTPTHPIDHLSSKDLTPKQQQKIDYIKTKNSDNSFAQDWVIEYYVINHPQQTEEEIIRIIKEAEEKTVEWKQTLKNKNFIDSWILKHFIVYYPNDYQKRHDEAEATFNYLTAKYNRLEFATPDLLKHISVYYYKKHNEATERARIIYFKLKNIFFTTKLVNYNPSIINQYIIRNFDNPEKDLQDANILFDSFLREAQTDSKNFFHSQNEREIKSEEYLRLLFSYYPKPSKDIIHSIQEAYNQLRDTFKDDNFFGKYKELAFKRISVLFREKPVLGYNKLKFSISQKLKKPEYQNIDPNIMIQRFLGIPENRILKQT